jgi:PAS domain S-box-containing protein
MGSRIETVGSAPQDPAASDSDAGHSPTSRARALTAFRGARRFISLRTKFLLGTVMVIIAVMGALTAIVEHLQRAAIIHEIERRGTVLVRSLAAVSTDPFLVYNFTTLEQNVMRLAEEEDVQYAIIFDLEGRVVAHSAQPDQVGLVVSDPTSNRAARADEPLVQEVTTRQGAHYDFSYPLRVGEQRWGTVRVGLSKVRMEAEIARTRFELILLAAATLAIGALASALVAGRIARPVRQLAAGVTAVSRGDLDQRIQPSTSDEIGRLAAAFNDMANQLVEQRDALATSHRELSRRFTELSDLKGYTDNILASLTSGVITLDLRGRVATLNPVAGSLLECPLTEVRGTPHGQAFAKAPEVVDLLTRTLVTRVGTARALVGLKRRDGQTVPVEVTTAPLRGEQGNALGVVAAVRDLTAERQLEDQLRQAQKVEAVGRLAGGVAHDFNNLLTVISGRVQLLESQLAPDNPTRRHITLIGGAADRATAVTRQLLAFSRKQLLQLEVVDVNAIVESLKTMLRHLIGENVALVTILTAAPACIKADRGQLEQVLMNLAVNARDAMSQGGRLTIETRNVEVDGDSVREHIGVQPGSHVLLTVSDTGMGIDAKTKAHLFEPFFTTKAPGKGTGLGLATVYGIVTQSGGHISVESEPGRGATFRIYLPLVAVPADFPEAAPAQPRPARGSETVLVVEDEDEVRSLVVEILQLHGYTVLEARHPGEALLLAERHPDPIHLVVTDVVMPQIDGYELAERLQSTRPEMRVIYMSGYTDKTSVLRGVVGTGSTFLSKPFTPDALAKRVREVLDAATPQVR